MMEVKNLSFHYKGAPQVLKDVSFVMQPGQFLAILGNNGVGKSTLLKCFNHILRPDSGEVLLEGKNLLHISSREVARQVAFVSQSVPNTQMTVHDVVMLGRRPYMQWGFTEQDHAIVHDAMHRLGVEEMRGRFLSQLSGGEKQKVMLARALAQQPKVLLLDEPTSALDIQNQYQVLNIVREICHKDNMIAVVVIHDLNLALRFCDRFLLMKDGQVYRHGDRSILDSTALKEVYGVDAKVVEIEGWHMVLVEE
jgi:iron complex transport system ATP-binding protein